MFDLWTEETTYETWLSFPTLMNRSFIKDSKTVKLSPLDNAVRTIAAKNDDLIQLEAFINAALKEKTDYSHYFNDLSRQLAGTVDSPVNGGLANIVHFSPIANIKLMKKVLLKQSCYVMHLMILLLSCIVV